ncbi:MAG TPA: diacylglycerol kinase family protein [Hyphomicrobiales bacterium]|jgi:diacylglycerol kinase family enzyme
MRCHAILNSRAGTVIGAGPAAFEAKLTDAFRKAGHSISVETVEPAQIGPRLAAAAREGYDALIIGGGDGSVNAAATALLGRKTALGVLPLGTLNWLAQDLNISLDVDEAIRQLAEAEPQEIDVGEVNGSIFLCNSFIGLPPMISERRQDLRGQPIGERLRGYLALPKELARSVRRLALLIDDERAPRLTRALTVVISNNPYRVEAALMPKRRALDEGRLGLYISKHRTISQTVFLMVRAALGRWQGDPNLESQELQRLTIRSRAKRLRVSNDGELLWLDTPLRYRIRPKALTVLRPREAAA